MAPVTEFVLLPINPAADPETVSSATQANIATLLSQPGCRRVRSSRVHEDKAQLRLFADWDSVDAHKAFAANDAAYGPFRARLAPIVNFGPENPRRPPYHIAFAPFPPVALDGSGGDGKGKSPVAEVLQLYFAPDVADAERTAREAVVKEFLEKLGDGTKGMGMTGEISVGWSLETDVLFKGEPSRVLAAAIGWTSVEAHLKVRETEEFKRLIPMIRNLEGLKGMELCHVSNTTVESSK